MSFLAQHPDQWRAWREDYDGLVGTALEEIVRRSGAGSVFFAGDDLTDLPAIELAAKRGWFAIDDVTYVATEIQSIRLRFEQYCKDAPGALRGEIAWSQ